MTNPQMAAQHHASFQNQMPPQQTQNVSQQRQAPNAQPKGNQVQQQIPSTYNNYDPQLALFRLEKAKNVETWEDVEPEKQHVALQDLQNEVTKFRRNRGNVKRALDEIPSANCRRLINELVEDQTRELWKYNRTLQYTIACIDIEWRSVNRRQRQLKRVQVILETEQSGFQEPQTMKTPMNGLSNGQHDLNKPMKQNTGQQQQGQMNGQLNMAQQARANLLQQQHSMGLNPPFEQQSMNAPPPPGAHVHMGGMGGSMQMKGNPNAPPPPPPPPGGHGHGHGLGQMHGGVNAPPPPPPPPGGAHISHAPHNQQAHHQQAHHMHPHGNVMPGAFPGPMPMHGMKHGQPHIEVLDPRLQQHKPPKHTGHRNTSSESESDSEWESSLGSEPIHVRNVERGTYSLVDRRERGRSQHSARSKKSRSQKSHSKARTYSRSRSRSQHRPSRRRIDSELDGSPTKGRHSPAFSRSSSPRSSHGKLPPIHIHMNTNSGSGDEKMHKRQNSNTASPTSFNTKGKPDRIVTSQPMSRESSWERGSDTASFATSSAHTAEDGIFDARIRPRNHGRTQSFSRPQHNFSTSYEDRDRLHKIRYPPADDYPHQPPRDTYYENSAFSSRPLPHRRNTAANPFATAHYPPKPIRAASYSLDVHEPSYPAPRYVTDRPAGEDRFKMDELAGALFEHIQDSQQRAPLRRGRRDSGIVDGDEWDSRFTGARGGGYGGYRY
jgi:hypothetical protein